MTPRDREALRRIVAHIEKIESYLDQVGPGWPEDDMAIDAIAKRLEDVGEQVKSIGAGTLAAAPEVDWAAAKGMRTIIAHEYEDLVVDVVDATVREDLPGMKAAALRLLS
jgi:uncharacterized protein with HEPN domain